MKLSVPTGEENKPKTNQPKNKNLTPRIYWIYSFTLFSISELFFFFKTEGIFLIMLMNAILIWKLPD